MTDSVLSVYRELADDVGDLVHGWTTFRRMSLGEDVNAVLNRATAPFFALVQAALLSYAVSIVGRLLDREKSAGQRTASILVLLQMTDLPHDARSALINQLATLREFAAPVIRYRNKRVAHTDYSIRAEGVASDLFTFAEFDEVVRRLATLMNDFERAARIEVIPYGNSDGSRDVDDLVRLLR